MSNTYELKTTKELNLIANGLTKSVKGLNSRLQIFVGCFIVSYNQNKDNNPFNNLMQALASEETYKTTKTKIINWISNTTNYRVKWKKDSNYFAITYKDEEDIKLKEGRLADIAPTMLDLMGLEKPEEMTGESLIEK